MRVALAVVTGVACAASVLAHRDQQVFRSEVQTVFVDVSVLSGRTPVADLTATNFTLSDNGARQRIESLAGTAIPLDVTLVVDATWFAQGLPGAGIGPAGTDILHRNAGQIAELLRPDDRLGVITFGTEVVETRPMSPVGANPLKISLANPTTWALDNRPRIGQALLTALCAPVPTDRRHLVLLFSAARGVSDVPQREHLVLAAKRADVLLYAVLTPRQQNSVTHEPYEFFPSEVVIRDAITKAAEATGGKTYLTGDIVGAFREILKQFRSSYVLRYTLDGVPAAGWHDIVVKVPSCPTCTIRARRGYMGR